MHPNDIPLVPQTTYSFVKKGEKMSYFKYSKLLVLLGLIMLVVAKPVFAIKPPQAIITAVSPDRGEAPLNIILDASGSKKGDGEIINYKWDIRGEQSEILLGKKTQTILEKPGVYTISLTVSDANGLVDIANDIKTVTVTAKPVLAVKPPQAIITKISPNLLVDKVPFEMTLDASSSIKGDGDIIYYIWEIQGKHSESLLGKTQTISVIPDIYTIRLTVVDTNGLVDTADQTVSVILKPEPQPEPLRVIPHIFPISGCAPLKVTLDGRDSIGNIESYEWLIMEPDGSETIVSGIITQAILMKVGNYTITLKATGENGDFSYSKSQIITVGYCPVKACFKVPTISDKVTIDSSRFESVILGNITRNQSLRVVLDAGCSESDFTDLQWEVNGEYFNNEKKTSIWLEDPGEYIISLIASNSTGNIDIAIGRFKVGKLRAIAKVSDFTQAIHQSTETIVLQLDATESHFGIYSIEELEYDWTVKVSSDSEQKCEAIIEPLLKVNTVQAESILEIPKGISCTYTATLKITDPDGVTDEDSVEFEIKSEPSEQPNISIFPPSHDFEEKVILTPSKPMLRKHQKSVPSKKPSKKADYLPKRVIVKFREGTRKEKKGSLRNLTAGTLLKTLPLINAEVWQVEDVEATVAVQQRRAYPDIEYIEPDYVIRPNDLKATGSISFSKWWGSRQENNGDIVSIETHDAVVCSVIDYGVNYEHSALKPKMWQNPGEVPDNGIDDDNNGYIDDVYGYDFVDDDGKPNDDCGHGTHVAGIIAGLANKDIDMTDTEWPVKVMALKIMKPTKTFSGYQCLGSSSYAVLALQYAVNMGIKCTNNSWGGEPYNQALADAIQAAGATGNTGQLFIAAAGNDFRQDIDQDAFYPASYDADNIISVCSNDSNDNLSIFSSFGKQDVDLCALGNRITSTFLKQKYQKQNGTSMAAAYVTGASALLWSAFPDLTASDIKTHLLLSAERNLNLANTSVTGGRLDLPAAIKSVQSHKQTFTIASTGETQLVINKVGFTGTHANEFKIHNDTCSSKSLSPNSSCSVEVFFAPTLKGNKQASLEVSSNVPQTATAPLSGNVKGDVVVGIAPSSLGENLIDIADNAIYKQETGEIEIPTVAVPNATEGSDIYWAKLCPISDNATLRFQLCDLTPINTDTKVGDTTFDAMTKIVNIPVVQLGSDTTLFYEVDLQLVTKPDGGLEFEVMEVIPIH